MTAHKFTLDTNILVYFIDKTNKERHNQAIKIINKAKDEGCILTMQSLAEFYHATVRKKLLSHKIAAEIIKDWQSIFSIAIAKTTTLTRAMQLTEHQQLSFWDAMLLATAQEAGVNLLLSEDFNHHQIIDGIRIVNPFKPSEFWSI